MKRFTIALSGLSGEDAALVRDEIDQHHARDWEAVEGTSAYLLVVDIDTTWGHMDWLRATANKQHVAVCTVNPQVRDADLVLHKPLRGEAISELLAQLEQLAERRPQAQAPQGSASPARTPLHAAPATASPATPKPVAPASEAVARPAPPAPPPVAAAVKPAPAPVPEPAPAPVPEPEPAPPMPMTLGAALLAGRIEHPLYFKDAHCELCLDPERGGYVGPAKLKPLQPLLAHMLDTATRMDEAAITRMREAPALPLTRLLWFAALVATPGRLDPRLDRMDTFRLDRWPQIEREFPRHFRIATSMMKQPGTLETIALASSAPESDVADFINAYYVAGYVGVTQPASTEVEAPAAGGKGMLRRLRKSFTRSSESEEQDAARAEGSLPPEA